MKRFNIIAKEDTRIGINSIKKGESIRVFSKDKRKRKHMVNVNDRFYWVTDLYLAKYFIHEINV